MQWNVGLKFASYLKQIKKSKLIGNLNTLNKEKDKLEDIKNYLSKTLKENKPKTEEFSGTQLKQLSDFNSEIIKKLEVSEIFTLNF